MQRSDTAPIEGRAGVGSAPLVTEPAVWSCDLAEAEVYRGVRPTVAIDTDYKVITVFIISLYFTKFKSFLWKKKKKKHLLILLGGCKHIFVNFDSLWILVLSNSSKAKILTDWNWISILDFTIKSNFNISSKKKKQRHYWKRLYFEKCCG